MQNKTFPRVLSRNTVLSRILRDTATCFLQTQGADDMPFGPKFMEYAEEEGSLLYGSNVSKGVKSPRRVALVHINFRMADQNADIAMTPAFAFMDMIASIGGHLIFCIVVLAIPGALLNRWFFYRALKVSWTLCNFIPPRCSPPRLSLSLQVPNFPFQTTCVLSWHITLQNLLSPLWKVQFHF